jgi:hypothetical protein
MPAMNYGLTFGQLLLMIQIKFQASDWLVFQHPSLTKPLQECTYHYIVARNVEFNRVSTTYNAPDKCD